MAWGSRGTLGGTGVKSADQTSIVHTIITTSPSAGDVVVVQIAVDNNQTTDGDEGAVSSVTDSGSNTYTKALEFCNGQGAAQAGTTCSVWYSKLGTGLTASSSTITANFTNNTSRDAAGISAWAFTCTAGATISIEATNSLANDGADAGSLNATTANAEFLRHRSFSAESGSTATFTATAGWTATPAGGPAGSGASATKQQVRGEFHISTGTGDASLPSWSDASDKASVYVAFKEAVVVLTGWGGLQHLMEGIGDPGVGVISQTLHTIEQGVP